jgi:hypothetical protein
MSRGVGIDISTFGLNDLFQGWEMTEDREEYERKKRAIFDGMSKRGRERILRIGYENWDPFQEPKDPRERIRSDSALRANGILNEFFAAHANDQRYRQFHKDLFDLCRGLLRDEPLSLALFDFCRWYGDRRI